MHEMKAETRRRKLLNLNEELGLQCRHLSQHPLTSSQLFILQNALTHLGKQAQWDAAGSFGRFLMAWQSALLGCETDESETGFIGPYLNRLQKTTAQLMELALPPYSGLQDMLLALTRTLTIASVYLMTETLGNWKSIFPTSDAASIKKAGLLLRELGVTFLLGSKAIEKAFATAVQSLEMDERHQKMVSYIGVLHVILIFLLMDEDDNPYPEEFILDLERLAHPYVSVLEEMIDKTSLQGEFDSQVLADARNQLNLILLAFSNHDREVLRQVLKGGLELFNIPPSQIKQDLKKLKNFCAQLHMSLNYAFNPTETVMTNMIQSA